MLLLQDAADDDEDDDDDAPSVVLLFFRKVLIHNYSGAFPSLFFAFLFAHPRTKSKVLSHGSRSIDGSMVAAGGSTWFDLLGGLNVTSGG